MKYSELELRKMSKAGNLNLEEQIKFNILNFIHVIHLNKQDFIQSSFETDYYGDLPMSFKKNTGQVMGLISVKTKNEERRYIFNDHGYELLEDLLQLTTF